MHRVRATNCFGAGLGQSEKAYLAFANQLRHRTDSFFNWRVRIDPVLIIKIDYIDIEPAQTSFARFLQVIRLAIDAAKLLFNRVAQNSELGRDDNFFAVTFQGAADQLFVGVRTVNVGGVEKRDPELERAMNGRD